MKEQQQQQTSEKHPNAMEVSNIPNTEFKKTIIRIFNKLESTIEELGEHFNKEIENVTKNQSKMKNITETKNILEEINSRRMNQ